MDIIPKRVEPVMKNGVSIPVMERENDYWLRVDKMCEAFQDSVPLPAESLWFRNLANPLEWEDGWYVAAEMWPVLLVDQKSEVNKWIKHSLRPEMLERSRKRPAPKPAVITPTSDQYPEVSTIGYSEVRSTSLPDSSASNQKHWLHLEDFGKALVWMPEETHAYVDEGNMMEADVRDINGERYVSVEGAVYLFAKHEAGVDQRKRVKHRRKMKEDLERIADKEGWVE